MLNYPDLYSSAAPYELTRVSIDKNLSSEPQTTARHEMDVTNSATESPLHPLLHPPVPLLPSPWKDPVPDISALIRQILTNIRRRVGKTDDGPKHWMVIGDNLFRSAKRAIIGIPTRGCSYARTSTGGCAVCGHSAKPGRTERSDKTRNL